MYVILDFFFVEKAPSGALEAPGVQIQGLSWAPVTPGAQMQRPSWAPWGPDSGPQLGPLRPLGPKFNGVWPVKICVFLLMVLLNTRFKRAFPSGIL